MSLRATQHGIDGYRDSRIFLRVAEAGSLRRAAEQLGTDSSTVSRAISGLEARLGVRLLDRSRTRSRLTDAGERYAARMAMLLAEIDTLEADVAGVQDSPLGLLRVSAAVDFGTRFVTPVLDRMQRDHPALAIELVLGSQFVDLAENGIDVAVRIGRLPDSDLLSRSLGAVPRIVVASPGYVATHGAPETPEAIAEHKFIHYGRLGRSLEIPFQGPAGRHTARPRGTFSVNSLSAVARLVEAGAGLHVGPTWAFADAIAAGRVVRLLEEFTTPAYPVNALFPRTPYVPAKTRRFVDAMLDELREARLS